MNKVRSILQLIISARPAMKAIEKESQSPLFTIIHGGKLRKKANANIFASKKEMNFGRKQKGLNRISDWILDCSFGSSFSYGPLPLIEISCNSDSISQRAFSG
jgi:hypothetical protein